MIAETLSAAQLEQALESLLGWKATPNGLWKEWKFPSFQSAMIFVNHGAELAEATIHHPDTDIRFNRVALTLITQDASGVTEKDLFLAQKIEALGGVKAQSFSNLTIFLF